jgi:hypothetical protein
MRFAPLVALVFTACAGSAPKTAVCPPAAPAALESLKPARAELAVLERFVGTWEGQGLGEPGASKVERTYRFVLGGKFLEVVNRSEYAPQPKNPKGEIHEDRGLVSWDRGGKRLVFRQFHVEGFVTHYASAGFSNDTLVFDSQSIENIPEGFRARETLRFLEDGRLEEVFEIAPPGKDYAVYSTATLTRR